MHDTLPTAPAQGDRRRLLAAFAASPAAVTGFGTFSRAARAEATSAGLITPNVCLVTREATFGPSRRDPALFRADIAEGRAGVPMRLQLQVVTADGAPVAGARVDIRHCDARGLYPGVPNDPAPGAPATGTSGTTFLRGTQETDARGIVTFQTIYPGRHRGRTTYIHCEIFLDAHTVLTCRVFFPDVLSEYLSRAVPPYTENASGRDTKSAAEGIAEQGAEGAFAALREQKEYYDAALVIGIDPGAPATGRKTPPPGAFGPDLASHRPPAPRAPVRA